MRTLYKVTYDVKVGRDWLGGRKAAGWSSMNLATRGDAVEAGARCRRTAFREDFDGKKPRDVRIVKVEIVAEDVRS